MPSRKQPVSKGSASSVAAGRAPRGQVGQQTYDHVRKVLEEKGVRLKEALDEVAKATGRAPGTVAVTYYRFGGGKRRGKGRRGRPPGPAARAQALTRESDAAAANDLLAQISSNLRKLQTVIADQTREIERLTKDAALAHRLRKALAGQ